MVDSEKYWRIARLILSASNGIAIRYHILHHGRSVDLESRMLQTCTNLIKNCKNIVVLTGAGISTESGIKDFRSQTGIYQMAPEYILSLDYFYSNPTAFYQFAVENLYHP